MAVSERIDLYAALPSELRERFDCARNDLRAITDWLEGEDLEIPDEAADQVCAWAEGIASDLWGEPLRLYQAPAQEELAIKDRAPTAEAHYTPPGVTAEVVFEVTGDEIRMVFKSSRKHFFALAQRGREKARRENVLYPLPPWSDELCARWAVQAAVIREAQGAS